MLQTAISVHQARRLALVKAGLLRPKLTGLPARSAGQGKGARTRSLRIIERLGYLQLDTVAISGARTHAIVLASRLDGFEAPLGETLLRPGEPLFEYWGHEVCWLPLSLYPYFAFRREAFSVHPWYGDVLGEQRQLADQLMRRIATEGPLRSLDFAGEVRATGRGWGAGKLTNRILDALWSAGHLAIRKRVNFQRVFDLTENVIPLTLREQRRDKLISLHHLLEVALKAHGWASTGTLAATWRLHGCRSEIEVRLAELEASGRIVSCEVVTAAKRRMGWIHTKDRDLVDQLGKWRIRTDQGVLLSPFDPVLWDRERVGWLFDFEQILEIYKPAYKRRFGYYCLPVLAGERLIARVDLRAQRHEDYLNVLSIHYERPPTPTDKAAVHGALLRFQRAVGLSRLRGGVSQQ